MSIDHSALAAEIASDQVYTGKTDIQIADILNVVNDSSGTVSVNFVSPLDMQEVVDTTEFIALTTAQQNLWGDIVGRDDDIPLSAGITQQVKDIWAAPTATRAALIALATKRASRAEVLFGEDAVVSHEDVAKAQGRG